MGFRGVLPPRETGGARAVPEPRDAEEQLHPVPAEGGCLPQPTPWTPAASPPPPAGIPARVPSSALNHLCVHFWQNLVLWLVLGGRNAIVWGKRSGKLHHRALPSPWVLSEVLK